MTEREKQTSSRQELRLFVGLMSMFCTFVLSFRDKRRKLVPALCTSCRPKHESAFRFSPRIRCDCSRSYQLPSGKFSERSLLTCQYSSYSSVHTTTHLLPKDANVTDINGTTLNGKSRSVIESSEDEKRSLVSLDSSSRSLTSDKRYPSDDVQNYSCLVKNFREPDVKGNTLVVLSKDGQTKNFYINNNILPKTHSSEITKGTNSLTSTTAHCSRSFKPYITIRNSSLSSKDTLDTKSDTSSEYIDDESYASSILPQQTTETQKSACQKYHQIKNTERLNSNSPSYSDIDNRHFMRTRCTCPRRKYAPSKNEIHFLGKSNKPIMRCTKPFKTKTPIHLFQAKENPTIEEGKIEEIGKTSENLDIDKSNEKSTTSNTSRKNSSTELLIREPDTLTSIVSLLD
ncbi:hypothetical protein Avbf_16516 [Armadillidium vulgare]|nr:hypothetical protein Avbf_16516 [Armadillidium vulgare]